MVAERQNADWMEMRDALKNLNKSFCTGAIRKTPTTIDNNLENYFCLFSVADQRVN